MSKAVLTAALGSALLFLAAQPASATLAHRRAHQHYSSNHTHTEQDGEALELLKPRGRLVNRAGQCAFPEGEAGLVTITPGSNNRGWALSPDQECTADSYCPFACEPGMVMNQWKKGSTYVYPESMAGGLYCDKSGSIVKPFPDQPYCVQGVGTVKAVNKCGKVVAFCQTVLPGNEAMLIPTSVTDSATIAVPGPSYWDSTASHFYINPPGHSTDEACIWGTGSQQIGNWSPYVAGANQDSNGNTFVKLGYNPIYTDSFHGVKPSFGLKIECDGNCNGLPCAIDPSTDGFGAVRSALSATGAGGADFCVVTVPKGSTANIVVFNTDGSTGDAPSSSSEKSSEKAATTSSPPKKAKVAAVATTSSSTPPATPEASSTSSSSSSSLSSSSSSTTSSTVTSSSSTPSSTKGSSTSFASSATFGGIFRESGRPSSTESSTTVTSAAELADATREAAPAAATSSKSDAANPDQGKAAFAGFVIAFIAAAMLY
ncbi:hypothetical protein Daus18300_001642 [Diaporthe australafricana]|uniref:Uncharacterized protein n=1 Tax=Diaporthe australafricana TaxID=127596 RepID=A0ABR3XUW9_9PEZI